MKTTTYSGFTLITVKRPLSLHDRIALYFSALFLLGFVWISIGLTGFIWDHTIASGVKNTAKIHSVKPVIQNLSCAIQTVE